MLFPETQGNTWEQTKLSLLWEERNEPNTIFLVYFQPLICIFFWQVTGLREAIPGKKRLKYFHQPNVLTTRTINGFFPQELTVSLLGQSWTYDLKPFLNSGCFVWIISASTSGNNQIFTDIQNISETLKLKKKKGKNWWLFLRTSWTKKCIYSPPC